MILSSTITSKAGINSLFAVCLVALTTDCAFTSRPGNLVMSGTPISAVSVGVRNGKSSVENGTLGLANKLNYIKSAKETVDDLAKQMEIQVLQDAKEMYTAAKKIYNLNLHEAEFNYRTQSRKNTKERNTQLADLFSYIRYSYRPEEEILVEEELYGFELVPDPHFFTYFEGPQEMEILEEEGPLEPCPQPDGYVSLDVMPRANREFLDMSQIFNGRPEARQDDLEAEFEHGIELLVAQANVYHDHIETELRDSKTRAFKEAAESLRQVEREIQVTIHEALESLRETKTVAAVQMLQKMEQLFVKGGDDGATSPASNDTTTPANSTTLANAYGDVEFVIDSSQIQEQCDTDMIAGHFAAAASCFS